MPRPWSRYGVPDPINLHWHTYGVILKHNSDWFTLGGGLNNMYHITKLASRHKNAHYFQDTYTTFVWKYDATTRHAEQTRILGNGYAWCPMMTTWQNHTGTFFNNWNKKISLSAKREIARKFYRAGIVPQSGVSLDHPTWKEVWIHHFLITLRIIVSHLSHRWFSHYFSDVQLISESLKCGYIFSSLFRFTLKNIGIFYSFAFLRLHGLYKTMQPGYHTAKIV